MPETPIANGSNGDRDSQGRFLPGNRGGPGNPLAARVYALRSALIEAVSAEDVREIAETLIRLAKSGDTIAARILFDRVLGKPLEADILARVEELEDVLAKGET